MKIYYKYIAPIRSYTTSFIRVKPNIEKMKAKINYLKSVPQPVQRTPEWYEFRSKCLTASNIWKAFVSESSKNQEYYSGGGDKASEPSENVQEALRNLRQNKENVFKDSKKNSSSKNNLTKTVFFVALLTVAGYVLLNETKQGNKLLALLK